MPTEPGPAEGPNVLRTLLRALVDFAGLLVAIRPLFRRATRHKHRPHHANDTHETRGVALPVGDPGYPPVTHCVHCGRALADVRTLGCGGVNRKGICPRLAR